MATKKNIKIAPPASATLLVADNSANATENPKTPEPKQAEAQTKPKEKRGIRLTNVVLPALAPPPSLTAPQQMDSQEEIPESDIKNLEIPKLSVVDIKKLPETPKLNLPMDVGPSPIIDENSSPDKSKSSKDGMEALVQLATSTIVKVQRQELDIEQIKSRLEEQERTLRSTIDYINATAIQIQTLGAQNVYMGWQARLIEYNLLALAGMQVNPELIDQAKFEVNRWSQDANMRQRQAHEAYGKLSR